MKTILAHPKLMFWSAIPVGITLALYVYVISRLQDWAKLRVTEVLGAWGWTPDSWAAAVALFVAQLALFLLSAVTFSFVATIVASPFNDLLAESSERWAEPQLPSVPSTTFGEKVRIIGIDIAKTVAATAATLVAILLSWIPIVNLFAFAAAFLLVTFQYVSYPQTRRKQGVREGLRFLWRHFYACAGFGAVFSLLFAVPLLSSLALPLAVVGGTLLAARAPGSGQRLPGLR